MTRPGRGDGKVSVRCLGPAKKEHTFLSADPRHERICWRCRQWMAKRRLGAIADSPLSPRLGEETYAE